MAYLATLGVSILVAPWLCAWAHSVATHYPTHTFFNWLAHYSPDTWANRVQLLLLVFFLLYIRRKYKLNIIIFDEKAWRHGWGGYGLGLIFSVSIFFCAYGAGILTLKTNFVPTLQFVCVKVVLSALVLALVEEWIFRGVIFQACLRFFKWRWTAIIVCSLMFAFAHVGIKWTVHWQTLFTNIPWAYLVMLFCLSVFLCLQTLRTRSLMFAVGFHAAIVGWLFLQRAYCVPQTVMENSWLWGDGLLQHAPLTSLVLLCLCGFSRRIQLS